jgi:hypothetical protein
MKYLIALFLITFSVSLRADYQDEINATLKLVEAGKNAEAMDRFFQANKYVAKVGEKYTDARDAFVAATKDLGPVDSIKKVGEYKFSDTLLLVEYMVVYDRQPVIIKFMFMQKKEGWRALNMNYSGDIDDQIYELGGRELIWKGSKQKGALESEDGRAKTTEQKTPNQQSPDPTPVAVTPAAAAPVAPAIGHGSS